MLELITFAFFQIFTFTGSPAASQAAYRPVTEVSSTTAQQSADDDTSTIGNEGWDND